jgi:eukaryotic-like serine/threonine-protein kinase
MISSDPPMKLFVDGKPVGEGSASHEVPPGKHTVKGVDGKSGASKSKVVMVKPGKTMSVELEVGTGSIVVEAPAGSKVFVDGALKGTAPMSPIQVTEGTRKVVVKKDGLEYRHNVPVKPGTESVLTVQFYTN